MHDGKRPQPLPFRTWQVVAQELTVETNPERTLELAQELTRALDRQEFEKRRRIHLAAPSPCPTNQTGADYQGIVDKAKALMSADYASLQMLFPERGSGGELRLLAFLGFDPDAARFWEWVRADSKSTCGIALLTKERVIAPDIAGCEFMANSDDQRTYLHTGILACQTTPLTGHDGNVVGMISTHWRRTHQPSEQDLRSFDALAVQAAELIERAAEKDSSGIPSS